METTKKSYFRLYAKESSMRTFKALDLKSGCYVSKLFYATMLEETEAYRVLADVRANNPEIEFKVMPCGC
jgi:hypothetical protein